MSRGAGGTSGGTGRFFIGLIMMVAGGYLFLDSVRVSNSFGLAFSLFSYGGFHMTGGMVLIPLMFGAGLIFYNSKSILGWALSIASLIMLGFGIIRSINFSIKNMSAFELITILVLVSGGVGLFLSSLKNYDQDQ